MLSHMITWRKVESYRHHRQAEPAGSRTSTGEIPVMLRRYFSLGRKLYLQVRPSKVKRETKEERAARSQRLMEENGWSRAELARQLGVSRAWVTKVLQDEA